ncbi:hypothetical protein [Desulfitobacterium hafniense]|uniref:hypothetical protein n=1 Tax=Desulfitobacterium hafniense TaxID=49338 RepID=UPI00037E1680|nr:hypothetical protein [Desulfitobacterium hafniense]
MKLLFQFVNKCYETKDRHPGKLPSAESILYNTDMDFGKENLAGAEPLAKTAA